LCCLLLLMWSYCDDHPCWLLEEEAKGSGCCSDFLERKWLLDKRLLKEERLVLQLLLWRLWSGSVDPLLLWLGHHQEGDLLLLLLLLLLLELLELLLENWLLLEKLLLLAEH
jgi:hypothetical protein